MLRLICSKENVSRFRDRIEKERGTTTTTYECQAIDPSGRLRKNIAANETKPGRVLTAEVKEQGPMRLALFEPTSESRSAGTSPEDVCVVKWI